MKLRIPVYDGPVSPFDRATVDIPTTDNGSEFKTIIPINNVHGGTASTAVLTVVGTAEQTSKGVRRVLVKVELPYASLQKCGCDNAEYQVDTAVSGESISLHTVLTLPKQAVKDLGAADGTREAVFERICILQSIMGILMNTDIAYSAVNSESSTLSFASLRDGALTAATVTDGAVWSASALASTNSPFVRGAALLKPFVNDTTYEGFAI